MLRSDGKDIVKKSSTRKGRYLLVFNFQLAPAAAGKLVRLAALSMRMRWSDGWGCRVQGAACATLGQQRCCPAPHLPPDHARCKPAARRSLPPASPLLPTHPFTLCRAHLPSWTARTRSCTSTSRRGGTKCLVRQCVNAGRETLC